MLRKTFAAIRLMSAVSLVYVVGCGGGVVLPPNDPIPPDGPSPPSTKALVLNVDRSSLIAMDSANNTVTLTATVSGGTPAGNYTWTITGAVDQSGNPVPGLVTAIASVANTATYTSPDTPPSQVTVFADVTIMAQVQIDGTLVSDEVTIRITLSPSASASVRIAQSGGTTEVTEAGATDTYSIVLNSRPVADVTVTINPDDQLDLGAGPGAAITQTFTSADWNVAQTVTVAAVNDSVDEAATHSGRISHSVASGDGNYSGIPVTEVTAQITDNDAAGVTITESGGSTTATEGGVTDTYTVVLNTQPAANVTVTIDPDTDLDLGSGTGVPIILTFTASNWNMVQTVIVIAVDDSVDETSPHTGTITHTVASADANYNAIAVGAVTVNVTDNDTAGLSIDDATVTEGNAGTKLMTVTVTLSPASEQVVTVDYATADNTATLADTDYAAAAGTLTFNAGESSKTIDVTINGDTTIEPDETFFVNLSNATGGANITDNQGTGTISNDDGLPNLTIDNVVVAEGDAGVVNAVFTVTLSAASALVVTVQYTTADNTATIADGDYTAVAGTLTFVPADTSENITVPVNGDTTVEGNETFSVNLFNASNAAIADSEGLGTILGDDSTAPTVTAVNVVDGSNVDVTFSKAMGAGVTTAANYTVSGSGKGSLGSNPSAAALQAGNTYRLTWASGEMVNGGDITITVANVQDASANLIGSPNSGTDAGAGIGTDPTVGSVAVQTSSTIDVTFSEPMGSGVATASNYTLSGTGQGSLANNPDSVTHQGGNVYRLTWATGEMFNGGNITITVANAQDTAGNTIGAPTSGTDVGGAVGTAPTVVTVAVQTDLTVNVTFSEAMGAGVTTAVNYAISGAGRGSLTADPNSVAQVGSTNTYTLTWVAGEMVDGADVIITVAAVQDAAGNAIGTPNSGTHTAGGMGTAPTVTAVAVQTGLTVDVTFSEAMGAGVTTAANYTVSGSGQGTLAANPTGVALQAGNTYRLTWASGEMVNAGDITITVANAQDAAGNAIGSPNSDTDGGGAIAADPTVSSVAVQTGSTVDVTFNEPMGSGVTTTSNYTLSGTGQGSLANNPDSVTHQGGNVYRLTWATGEMFNGGNITITVANAEDAAGNGIGAPNNGTDAAGAIGTAPTVNSASRKNATRIEIVFNEPMNQASVENLAAYTFSGGNVTAAALQPDNVTVRLTVDADPAGDTIQVDTTVIDLAGNALQANWTSGTL